jgi:hypothetical protein
MAVHTSPSCLLARVSNLSDLRDKSRWVPGFGMAVEAVASRRQLLPLAVLRNSSPNSTAPYSPSLLVGRACWAPPWEPWKVGWRDVARTSKPALSSLRATKGEILEMSSLWKPVEKGACFSRSSLYTKQISEGILRLSSWSEVITIT